MSDRDLLGDVYAPPDTRLTARQRLALQFVAAHDLVPSDELGAVLHEERRARGGRGHGRDVRCDYCGEEGSQMGRALERKGLVKRKLRRGDVEGGWYVPDRGPDRESADRTAQLGADDPFPEGF